MSLFFLEQNNSNAGLHKKEIYMRLKYLFILTFLFSTACAPKQVISNSGIEGNVTIGPTCPVIQANNPCPDEPYQAAITILNTNQQKVTQFQTDANGYFHVALAPGEYTLHPESPNVMPHANDIPFTVKAGEFTKVDVAYDSGIR